MKIILLVGAVVLIVVIGVVAMVLFGMARCAEAQDESRDDLGPSDGRE